jgi:4-hydroxy-3-polyprenylbenzoate decarboxylase
VGQKRLVVGISGASGTPYGIRLLEVLAERSDIETHLVITGPAQLVIAQETDYTIAQVGSLADRVYDPDDLAAPIASGSFPVDGMVISPCSVKMLSAVANSYAADLVSRAADVTLKEGRPLVLLVRETPLHLGHLRLMAHAAEIGAVIFPPVPAFYGRPQTVADIVDSTVGRVLARLGVENDLYARWEG